MGDRWSRGGELMWDFRGLGWGVAACLVVIPTVAGVRHGRLLWRLGFIVRNLCMVMNWKFVS